MRTEGVNIEYKIDYSENIKKSVIAFANTDGGKIYIGVDDNAKIIGLTNPDEIMLKLTNAIRDSISPDVTMFTTCETQYIDNKTVVVLTVQKGSSYPYYLKNKGIRPEGIYIRQGASSVPASESMIIRMIKENTGNSYEETRSLNQNLTFEHLKNEFKNADLPITESKMQSLGIIDGDQLYTNLGLLLSDQCNHSIKLAVFEGNTKNLFKDRYEFTGSLLKQLSEVYSTINRYNKTSAHFESLKRIDVNEYPLPAIRETLLNTIVHRDYSYSASTLISIYDDRIEFLSIGGLVKGITKEDILLGISITRNKNLANVFYRLKYIEAYGTGIGKILESYANKPLKPAIEISNNAFKVTLPSLTALANDNPYDKLSKNEKRALDIFSNSSQIIRKDLEKKLSISQSMAVKILKNLLNYDLIEKHRKGKSVFYNLKD